jgi:hypothetical protein
MMNSYDDFLQTESETEVGQETIRRLYKSLDKNLAPFYESPAALQDACREITGLSEWVIVNEAVVEYDVGGMDYFVVGFEYLDNGYIMVVSIDLL